MTCAPAELICCGLAASAQQLGAHFATAGTIDLPVKAAVHSAHEGCVPFCDLSSAGKLTSPAGYTVVEMLAICSTHRLRDRGRTSHVSTMMPNAKAAGSDMYFCKSLLLDTHAYDTCGSAIHMYCEHIYS